MTSEDEKPCVLVLGGCGFVGRHLVAYLLENNLVTKVRVADKTPPLTAWLNEKHKQIFEDPRVDFKQANLLNPAISGYDYGTRGCRKVIVHLLLFALTLFLFTPLAAIT